MSRFARGRLVVNNITTEGRKRQRVVLNAISEELVPNTFYRLIVEQPIPEKAEALPMFIRMHEGAMFAPTVSVSDFPPCHCECEEFEHEHEEFEGIEEMCGCEKRSKLIPVNKSCLGQMAFGIDLSACKHSDDIPANCIIVFLTNAGHFTLVRPRHRI